MAQRIRTVKPEFFQHEDLSDLEQRVGLPVRLAFIGLWTCCDREGRFKWRPRRLKSDILPYDDLDFADVLEALAAAGFIVRYQNDRDVYGYIPSWHRHQVINVREAKSCIPDPTHEVEPVDASQLHEQQGPAANTCMHVSARSEVEMEMERKQEGITGRSDPPAIPTVRIDENKEFLADDFVSELRRIWPRPEFGYLSEQYAVEALEAEMREGNLTIVAAAELVLTRVRQIALLVSHWPREKKHLVPGLTNLLKNRKYKQNDCFWEHHDEQQSKHSEREQQLERLVAAVAQS
jgi:hypothetical protein